MIILIRHGQTTTNARQLLVGRLDPELTERGEEQARALAPYLVGVEEAWVSPLRRARATAELALPELTAQVRDSFIEVDYGDLEGQPIAALTAEHRLAYEADHESAFPGGESLGSVDRRVHEELDGLLDDEASLLHDPHRHLAIISHVAPIKSAVVWSLGVGGPVTWRTRLDNGSITTITTRAGRPLLVNFNVVPIPGERAPVAPQGPPHVR